MNPMVRKMAKKKAAPKASTGTGRPKGRPKQGGRIMTRFSMVASEEYLAGMAKIAVAMKKADVTEAMRQIVREAADKLGIEMPPI